MGVRVFLSYGASDEDFASKLNDRLKKGGLSTWFFRDDAVPGQRLHRVMRNGVYDCDRVVLICSESALQRSGVNNEIEKVLEREAREGGEEILVPITLDDFVFTNWEPTSPLLMEREQEILSRVVADFRGAKSSDRKFDDSAEKLIHALLGRSTT